MKPTFIYKSSIYRTLHMQQLRDMEDMKINRIYICKSHKSQRSGTQEMSSLFLEKLKTISYEMIKEHPYTIEHV